MSCEFIDRMGITVVHHNSEDRSSVKGKGKNQWSKVPKYDNDITYDQIKAIIDNSNICYQEIM